MTIYKLKDHNLSLLLAIFLHNRHVNYPEDISVEFKLRIRVNQICIALTLFSR